MKKSITIFQNLKIHNLSESILNIPQIFQIFTSCNTRLKFQPIRKWPEKSFSKLVEISFNDLKAILINLLLVERGISLVDSALFIRRVAGSNPALAAT